MVTGDTAPSRKVNNGTLRVGRTRISQQVEEDPKFHVQKLGGCRCLLMRPGGTRTGSEKGDGRPTTGLVKKSGPRYSQLGQLLEVFGTCRETRESYCCRVRTKSAGPTAGPRLREAKEATKATTWAALNAYRGSQCSIAMSGKAFARRAPRIVPVDPHRVEDEGKKETRVV
jgi:hypothetical protein